MATYTTTLCAPRPDELEALAKAKVGQPQTVGTGQPFRPTALLSMTAPLKTGKGWTTLVTYSLEPT